MGDVLASLTALGLHRDSSTQVSIRSEVRRRIFASIFNIDKTLASFTGRPPFLSHRYISCPLPLDLSDEALLMPQADLAKEIAKLDSKGWNTDGVITRATCIRVNMYLAVISNEILELSLGSWSDNLPETIW
jgi:hypothetical protein